MFGAALLRLWTINHPNSHSFAAGHKGQMADTKRKHGNHNQGARHKEETAMVMKKSSKEEIISDFVVILNQIDAKPPDEIESSLQDIIHRIRPHIHRT